jgi:hypothetical protein
VSISTEGLRLIDDEKKPPLSGYGLASNFET